MNHKNRKIFTTCCLGCRRKWSIAINQFVRGGMNPNTHTNVDLNSKTVCWRNSFVYVECTTEWKNYQFQVESFRTLYGSCFILNLFYSSNESKRRRRRKRKKRVRFLWLLFQPLIHLTMRIFFFTFSSERFNRAQSIQYLFHRLPTLSHPFPFQWKEEEKKSIRIHNRFSNSSFDWIFVEFLVLRFVSLNCLQSSCVL